MIMIMIMQTNYTSNALSGIGEYKKKWQIQPQLFVAQVTREPVSQNTDHNHL